MPVASAQFDRVRTDRATQHMQHPERALAEMWRVLRLRVLVLVEPEWRGIMLYPGSPAGGDDSSTLQRVLAYMQRLLPHIFTPATRCLGQIQVQAVSFMHTVWSVVDAVLQIRTMARAFVRLTPAHAEEIEAWLHAIETSAQQEAFLASVPLF